MSVDLHTHTLRSDGNLSPEALIRKAYAAGIRVLSITDHNYTEDLTKLRKIAADFPEGLALIQGAEVSALYTDSTGTEAELHIVALGFDPENPGIKALLEQSRPDRRPYIEAFLKRLREECGIDLGSYDEIRAHFPDTPYIGKKALAALMEKKGITTTAEEAFDVYLGRQGKAHVESPLRYFPLEEVLHRIYQAGGIPILAHLLYYRWNREDRIHFQENDRLLARFHALTVGAGKAGGMEVHYGRYTALQREYLEACAHKFGLLISAGSDYHGQQAWETLAPGAPCSACGELLARLGVSP